MMQYLNVASDVALQALHWVLCCCTSVVKKPECMTRLCIQKAKAILNSAWLRLPRPHLLSSHSSSLPVYRFPPEKAFQHNRTAEDAGVEHVWHGPFVPMPVVLLLLHVVLMSHVCVRVPVVLLLLHVVRGVLLSHACVRVPVEFLYCCSAVSFALIQVRAFVMMSVAPPSPYQV